MRTKHLILILIGVIIATIVFIVFGPAGEPNDSFKHIVVQTHQQLKEFQVSQVPRRVIFKSHNTCPECAPPFLVGCVISVIFETKLAHLNLYPAPQRLVAAAALPHKALFVLSITPLLSARNECAIFPAPWGRIGHTFRKFVQIINLLSFINILKWFIDFLDPLSGLELTIQCPGNFSTAPEVC